MNSIPGRICLLMIIDQAQLGGGQRQLFWLAKYLNPQKFKVVVICGGKGYLTQALESEGIEYLTFPQKLGLRDFLKLRQSIRKMKPGVVHTHGTVAGVCGRLASLRMTRPKLVHTLHGIHYLHYPGSFKKVVGIWSEKILSWFTDKIVCVSEADRRKGLSQKLFPAEKTVVIANAVPPLPPQDCHHLAKIREELGVTKENLLVGTVGRLHRQKGLIYFLLAARLLSEKLPQVKYLIVGDGPQREFLVKQARNLGLKDRILFFGPTENVNQLLRIFDILVLPSLWEGMPLILLEGMQAGQAIVASRIEGVIEIITDQESGYLFTAGQPEELAQAILVLANDPQKRKSLGEGAFRRAQDFSLVEMVRTYQELYLNLIRDQTRP